MAAQASREPFPVESKYKSKVVDGARTDVMCMQFVDKILLTIVQDGRLAHWVHVPLSSSDPTHSDRRLIPDGDGAEYLPLPQLTASTLLGGGHTERETTGQLLATQIGTAIVTRSPDEKRLLVVGLGLYKLRMEREAFLEILELAFQCI